MDEPRGWARLWVTARPRTDPQPRQGTWYRICGTERPDRVVLDVQGHHVAVPRYLLEFRDERPERFAVVYRGRKEANPASGSRDNLGRTYAVCPSCAARVRLRGRPERIECSNCGHGGEVAWWETG